MREVVSTRLPMFTPEGHLSYEVRKKLKALHLYVEVALLLGGSIWI